MVVRPVYDGLTALAGGAQAGTPLREGINRVTTVATAADSSQIARESEWCAADRRCRCRSIWRRHVWSLQLAHRVQIFARTHVDARILHGVDGTGQSYRVHAARFRRINHGLRRLVLCMRDHNGRTHHQPHHETHHHAKCKPRHQSYAVRIACHWPAPVMTNNAVLLAAIANAAFAASALIFSPVAGYTFMLLDAAALTTIRSSPVTS